MYINKELFNVLFLLKIIILIISRYDTLYMLYNNIIHIKQYILLSLKINILVIIMFKLIFIDNT